jgi:hypothetical protein
MYSIDLKGDRDKNRLIILGEWGSPRMPRREGTHEGYPYRLIVGLERKKAIDPPRIDRFLLFGF